MLTMKILGQCPSGKNAVKITRFGKRYPSKRFVEWREKALSHIIHYEEAFKAKPINKPCNIKIDYWSGDKRRRDAPGIIDAIYHLLEKAEVVTDDTFLGGDGCSLVFNNHGKSSDPRVEITIH